MERFFKQLQENWVIIIFLGTVVMSWTMFSARLTQAEGKIESLETVTTELTQLKIDIAVIKADVGYIKQNIHDN